MKRNASLLFFIGLIALVSQREALSQDPTRSIEPPKSGFAKTVSGLLLHMQGEWRIKSASLQGASLPLDPFESLTIDDKGFTLNIQKGEARFVFAEFELESKRFLAKCSSPDYPKGLTYEISMSDELVKIRYRTNGADVAPESSTKDSQLLIQTWTKSRAK